LFINSSDFLFRPFARSNDISPVRLFALSPDSSRQSLVVGRRPVPRSEETRDCWSLIFYLRSISR